jgi:hypothetical protein
MTHPHKPRPGIRGIRLPVAQPPPPDAYIGNRLSSSLHL